MPLPRHILAPAFCRRQLGLSYAFMIGIMVYFATFAIAAEAVLSMTSFTWDKNMQSQVTIEIPAMDDEASTSQADRVTQILTALHALPGVGKATVMPDEETARLLKPWIGQPELLKELPVPTLIEVERKGHLPVTDIQKALKNIASDVRIEDHAAWIGGLAGLADGLSALAWLIIVLSGVTLVLAVGLLCRTIMATEHEAIALLHVMGADDGDIARHFQFHARHKALPAAFTGFGLAIVSAVPFLFLLRHFMDLFVMQAAHWLMLGVLILLAPLAAIGIAALTARFSALRLLREMP